MQQGTEVDKVRLERCLPSVSEREREWKGLSFVDWFRFGARPSFVSVNGSCYLLVIKIPFYSLKIRCETEWQ